MECSTRTTRLMYTLRARRLVSMKSVVIWYFWTTFFSGRGGMMMPAFVEQTSCQGNALQVPETPEKTSTRREGHMVEPAGAQKAGLPLFCSCSRKWSQAKSRNRLMTSICLYLYCGMLVSVQIL